MRAMAEVGAFIRGLSYLETQTKYEQGSRMHGRLAFPSHCLTNGGLASAPA